MTVRSGDVIDGDAVVVVARESCILQTEGWSGKLKDVTTDQSIGMSGTKSDS